MNRRYMEGQIEQLQSMLNRGAFDRHPYREDRDMQISEILEEAPCLATLSLLLSVDPQSLGEQGRLDYMVSMERHIAWLQPIHARALVAVAGNGGKKPGQLSSQVDEEEREEVATALRISPSTAQSRIDVARVLVNHLPQTCAALASGDLSPTHATVIARETAQAIRHGLPKEAISMVESSAIAHSEFHTPGQVGRQLRTQIAQINPKDFEEDTELIRSSRKVTCYDEPNGMSTVVAILPAEDAQIVMRAIEAFISEQEGQEATKVDGVTGGPESFTSEPFNPEVVELRKRIDPFAPQGGAHVRTMDMKRADALTRIAELSLVKSNEKTAAHRRPFTINVTIDLPTLLGLKENPGQLVGYGPIPAKIARQLALDGRWKRFVTDPQTGALLDYGRESYEPPQPLVDYIVARDRICRFPGCRHSAMRSDIDHAKSWDSGGITSKENLGLLCRRHHRMKTHGGWKLESRADGSCDWTSPQGRVFHVPARPVTEAV